MAFRLDLPDPFPGQFEMLADLFESPRFATVEPEAQSDDEPFTLVELAEELGGLGGQHRGGGGLEGACRRAVRDEVTELGVTVLAHRRRQREWLGGDLEGLGHLRRWEIELFGELGDRRPPSQLGLELDADLMQAGQVVASVDRQPDGAAGVRDPGRSTGGSTTSRKVEKLEAPLRQSNLSTAWDDPRLPSWMRSRSGSPDRW